MCAECGTAMTWNTVSGKPFNPWIKGHFHTYGIRVRYLASS